MNKLKIFFCLIAINLLTSCNYTPENSDIVQYKSSLSNGGKLEEFIQKVQNGKEGEVRIVRNYGKNSYNRNEFDDVSYERPEGTIIYDLKFVYDNQAGEGWIEVHPNLSHFKQSKNNPISIINDPQQCGYITKDNERGYYFLSECFHAWEYELFPLQ